MAAQTLHLNWFNPVRIHFGPGTLQHIATAAQAVVVLADPVALGAAGCEQVRTLLGARCLAWRNVAPGLSTLEQAEQHCNALWPVLQEHPNTLVLAVGGGTTLDLAKVLRWRMPFCTAQDVRAHWRANTLPDTAMRHLLWAVPTTAGTGSEVTRTATVWDTSAEPARKLAWAPDMGFADVALVDPGLTLSCPASITRDCALDSLAHALEALWNHRASPLTTGLAVQGAQDIVRALPQALARPQDLEPRTALSRASLMAGLAMSQTQTALAHALSYRLTLEEGLPHGQACAVWLPMVWELALGHSAECEHALAQIFAQSEPLSSRALHEWLRALDITPRDLRTNAAGQHLLQTEMQSPRGRNFIASPA